MVKNAKMVNIVEMAKEGSSSMVDSQNGGRWFKIVEIDKICEMVKPKQLEIGKMD